MIKIAQLSTGTPFMQTPVPEINNPFLPSQLSNLSGIAFFERAINLGINLGFVIGGLVFVFSFLIGAIKWISSSGDKAGLESAQKQITHALLGLAILLSIFAIIQLIGHLFGIDIIKLKIPTLLTAERG